MKLRGAVFKGGGDVTAVGAAVQVVICCGRVPSLHTGTHCSVRVVLGGSRVCVFTSLEEQKRDVWTIIVNIQPAQHQHITFDIVSILSR